VIASLQCVVLDCPDALELAQFYQSLLGGVINAADPRWSPGENWSTLVTRLRDAGSSRPGQDRLSR